MLSSRGRSEPEASAPIAAPVTDTAPLAAEPAAAPAVQPTVPAVVDEGSAAEAGSADGEADTEEVEPEVAEPPTATPSKKRIRHHVKREPKTVQAKGTGSAATTGSKTAPKVQWDPTMLMPTDQQKKKR
jgi:hypothetical protein